MEFPSMEEEEVAAARVEQKLEPISVDTGSTQAQAAEVIRQVGGMRIVKDPIKKRYRQGV